MNPLVLALMGSLGGGILGWGAQQRAEKWRREQLANLTPEQLTKYTNALYAALLKSPIWYQLKSGALGTANTLAGRYTDFGAGSGVANVANAANQSAYGSLLNMARLNLFQQAFGGAGGLLSARAGLGAQLGQTPDYLAMLGGAGLGAIGQAIPYLNPKTATPTSAGAAMNTGSWKDLLPKDPNSIFESLRAR